MIICTSIECIMLSFAESRPTVPHFRNLLIFNCGSFVKLTGRVMLSVGGGVKRISPTLTSGMLESFLI